MPSSDDRILVLAAGRGTRFGAPKALMPTGPGPEDIWWRRQQRAIDTAGVSATWIVNAEVRQAIADQPCAPADMIDADPASPMWHTLVAGLRHIAGRPCAAVLIQPVDVPVPRPSTFDALADANADVAVPKHGASRGHPVRIAAWAARHILPHADDPAARLDHIIQPVATDVEVDDPAVTFNINTREQLAAWLREPRA